MITYLQVPYAEKERAKKLGARWDIARKTWYIENVVDVTPFMRWMTDLQKQGPVKTYEKKKTYSYSYQYEYQDQSASYEDLDK